MIRWILTFNANTNIVRYSAQCTDGDFVDLSLVLPGDYVNVYGENFLPPNKGSFSVANVVVDYVLGNIIQYFEVLNPSAIAQTSVGQVSVTDVEFFRPHRATLNDAGDRTVVVVQTNEGLDIVIPATTEAIERGKNSGSYLHNSVAVAISSVTRATSGVVTVTAPDHGLSDGQWVFIDGVYANNTAPAVYSWSNATSFSVAAGTDDAAMTLLANGEVLVSGGSNLTSAYIYNATSGWRAVASMLQGRYGHALLTLRSGKAIAIGGNTATCSLYDSGTDTWTFTGGLLYSLQYHTATLLLDGRVLVVGGTNVPYAAIYNPATALWTTITAPSIARTHHIACLLNDGRVLIAGGQDAFNTPLNSAEIYNPANNSWLVTGSMASARYRAASALVNAGVTSSVLVSGGTINGIVGLSSSELYNPGTGSWTTTTSLSHGRFGHTMTLLPSGKPAAIGGNDSGNLLVTVEIYDFVSLKWSNTANMQHGRALHCAAYVPANGKLLVFGGFGVSSEVYNSPTVVQASGRLNGLFQITFIDGNSFRYTTTDSPFAASASGGTVTPFATPSDSIAGPFIYDPENGSAITGVEAVLQQDLNKGQTYKTLEVDVASDFPDAEGYLAFGFGTSDEVTPVRYLGRVSGTQLLLDPSFVLPHTVPAGASVTLLAGREPFVPEHPESVGSFYVTASAAGRVAAEETIDNLVAAGVPVTKTIIYPGDRGLGNEGEPTTGAAKLSDRVVVWGADDVDAEVAILKES